MSICVIIGDVNFDHLLNLCGPIFFIAKILFFFFSVSKYFQEDTSRLLKISYFLYFLPLILASTNNDSYLTQLLLCCLPNCNFSTSIITSTFIV